MPTEYGTRSMTMTDDIMTNVYCERDMPLAEVHVLPGGNAAVCSVRCPGKATPNEDAAALIPFRDDAAVLLVADGVGGGKVGNEASRLAVQAMQEALHQAEVHDWMLRTAIINGIESANEHVQSMGLGAATTMAVVEIQDGTARAYHVGDSMILLVGQRGKIKFQTISHSPVGFAVESGYLGAEAAMHHDDRHLVSNVIGTADMRIEIGPPLKLAPLDTLLLASDGLFDNLHIEEIVDRVRLGSLEQAMARVVNDTAARMQHPGEGHPSKPDDMTVVVYRLTRKPRTIRRKPVAVDMPPTIVVPSPEAVTARESVDETVCVLVD